MKSKTSCYRQLYYYLILPEDKDQTGMVDIAAYRHIMITDYTFIPIDNYSITYIIIYFDCYRISERYVQ